jgi:hypothetical protein
MHRGTGSARTVRTLAVIAAAAGALLAALPPGGCESDRGCSSNAECDDGVWCNGPETCGRTGRCYDSPAGPCDDGLACTTDGCDEATRTCTHTALDRDGDTFEDAICGGTDCDDEQAAVYPGAPELCDGLDNDCDGVVNEDRDGDGHWSAILCPGVGDDCDDANAERHPGAPEVCDGIDNDCDGVITDESDSDGDTAIDITCDAGTDCDDEDPAIHPGADEICNDADDDCDTLTDEGFPCRIGEVGVPCWTSCGSAGTGTCTSACRLPEGTACRVPDEICYNFVDDDCDGDIDEGCARPDGGCLPGSVECCADGVDDDCDTVVDEAGCVPHGSCPAGTMRSCDTGDAWGWGVQRCSTTGGAWGACTADVAPPGCPLGPTPGWDANCCALSGFCCEDTADGDRDGLTSDSVGLSCPPEPDCP